MAKHARPFFLASAILSLLAGCGSGESSGELKDVPEPFKEKKVFKTTECSGHTPEWVVTVEAESITWVRRYFYMRSLESYRLNLTTQELVYAIDEDVAMDPPLQEKVIQQSEPGYRQGLEKISKTLDKVVQGYGCWSPVPEAQTASDYVRTLLKNLETPRA